MIVLGPTSFVLEAWTRLRTASLIFLHTKITSPQMFFLHDGTVNFRGVRLVLRFYIQKNDLLMKKS